MGGVRGMGGFMADSWRIHGVLDMRDGHKGGVKGPLLMKRKRREHLHRNYVVGERFFIIICEVIVNQKKRSANQY